MVEGVRQAAIFYLVVDQSVLMKHSSPLYVTCGMRFVHRCLGCLPVCMGGNIELEMLRALLNSGISHGSKDVKSA